MCLKFEGKRRNRYRFHVAAFSKLKANANSDSKLWFLGNLGISYSLDMALEALDNDRAFLNKNNVFSNDMIDGYIALKMEEVTRLRMATHPCEFEMYYSL